MKAGGIESIRDQEGEKMSMMIRRIASRCSTISINLKPFKYISVRGSISWFKITNWDRDAVVDGVRHVDV